MNDTQSQLSGFGMGTARHVGIVFFYGGPAAQYIAWALCHETILSTVLISHLIMGILCTPENRGDSSEYMGIPRIPENANDSKDSSEMIGIPRIPDKSLGIPGIPLNS